MEKLILTVQEALAYQKLTYGRVVFGRDALYKMAKLDQIKTIKYGSRKLLIPAKTIDELMEGR